MLGGRLFRGAQGFAGEIGHVLVDPTGRSAGAATAAESYTLRWFRFDNATDTRSDVGEAMNVTALRADAPPELFKSGSDYAGVTFTAKHAQHPRWARPATFYFRRAASGGNAGWDTVGVER